MGNEENELEALKQSVIKLIVGMKPTDIECVEFEKDDETNFHVDFVHAAANLRARNYSIAYCDKLTTRGIAGHIIPAIATTTAMIVGCMCNEIMKIAQKVDKIELYKNSFINLAIPLFVFSEPASPVQVVSKEMDKLMGGPVQAIPEGHTKWDRLEMKGPLKLGDVMEKIQKMYNVDASMVACGELPLYMAGMSPKARLQMKVEDVVEEIAKSKLGPTVKSLRIDVVGESKDKHITALMPGIKYSLK